MKPIAVASTSNTAFIGFFKKGPLLEPTIVTSFADFDQYFGGLDSDSEASYSIHQYFANGGRVAFVLRVRSRSTPSRSQMLIDGLAALDEITPKIFNVLCIPEAAELSDSGKTVYEAANEYCLKERAFLIADIGKNVETIGDMTAWLTDTGGGLGRNAAVFFPRLEVGDPLNQYKPRNVTASGTVAGVFARTDAIRGVWKAPAGTEARLRGASVVTALNHNDNAELNVMGVNALRHFPSGDLLWGSRTLAGADHLASEWKYISVRRTALFVKESLDQGLRWAVFEPNDESLWAIIRRAVGVFMNDLFRLGAFQGTTPEDAYFVKCDSETTTPIDVNNGVVNTLVGFAPLKPAEFVIIKIQQLAGQAQR